MKIWKVYYNNDDNKDHRLWTFSGEIPLKLPKYFKILSNFKGMENIPLILLVFGFF